MDMNTFVESLRYLIEYFDIRQFLENNPPLRLLIIMALMAIMGLIARCICAFVHRKLIKYSTIKYQKVVKSHHGEKKEEVDGPIDVGMFDVVMRRARQLLYLLILGWATKQLVLGAGVSEALTLIVTALCTLMAILFLIAFVPFDMDVYFRKRGTTLQTSQTRSLMPIIKGIIWAIGLTFMLDNLGFHVSTIVAGLGIAGVAVGLAGQAILGDFFSYLVLLVDKPFRIGDFIELSDGKSGEIIYMGPKTTRLRSLEGNTIICANAEMTKGVIVNVGSIKEREVAIEIGVALNVPIPIVRRVPAIMKEVVETFPQCKFERACMTSFGTSNYLFQLIYRVATPGGDLNDFMNIQTELNLALTDRMNQEKMFGAYPTQEILFTDVTSKKKTDSASAS